MIRKLLVGTGALALLFGTVTSLSAGVASATPTVQFTGTVTCGVHGKVTFGTALTNGGTSSGNVTVSAALSTCSGAVTQGGVTLTHGVLKANSGLGTVTSDCATVLGGAALPTLTGMITWSSTGGHVITSGITITGAITKYLVSPNAVVVGLPTSFGTGSFSSPPESGQFSGLNSNTSGYALDSKCGNLLGLKSVAFGGTPTKGITGSVTIQAGA